MSTRSDHDDWKPLASKQGLGARARLYAKIREFFSAQNVLEVDTPILNEHAVTDVHIDSIRMGENSFNGYLHASPEYAMKRLLAFFRRDMYQLCKVFRDNEKGKYHHPEFTMLEWYRVGWSYHELMQEVDGLVKNLLQDRVQLDTTTFITYQNIFLDYCGLDPWLAMQPDYMRVCKQSGISLSTEISNQQCQELILDQVIVPQLQKHCLTFIYDFPGQQAALAKINRQGIAERFELYLGDIELANGFQELTDAQEQSLRFVCDNQLRQQVGKVQIEADQQFIAALQFGLPECAGVALGVDRLLMFLLGASEIKQVLAFTGA